MLDDNELERYSRQLSIDGWGTEGQEKLKACKALILGAGGSGSVVITEAALLGIGTLTICDFDRVELSNYNRQFIHSVGGEQRLGMGKAVSAAATVQSMNPHIVCNVVEDKVDRSNIDALVQEHDLVLDGCDDMVSKFIVSEAAARHHKHHITWGHMDINSFGAVLLPPETPCLHCLFNVNMVRAVEITRRVQAAGKIKRTGYPVMPTPVMTSTAFMMTEAVKLITGIAPPAYNRLFLFLNKGSERIAESLGYTLWKTWLSPHLVKEAAAQGFDFNGEVWRGRYVEELEIPPDPACPCCASN